MHPTPALVLAQTGTGGGSALANLLPFVLLAVAFWFLLIRPQRKRAQEAAQIRSSLQVGAEVMTTAGLYGTVAHVDDDAVLLEVAPGVTNRYANAAVARVLSTPGVDEDLVYEGLALPVVDDRVSYVTLRQDPLPGDNSRTDDPCVGNRCV